jgi:ferredoxin-NADP reductase
MTGPTPGRLLWQVGEVVALRQETALAKSLTLALPAWPGHRAGQHVDVRLTAEDGYQAERSYSIASPPEEPQVMLLVERIADGEVSPYLTEELRIGDRLEVRGPIGGYFVWELRLGGPLLLVGGGSGIVPLIAMLRHRTAAGSHVPARLLFSARTYEDLIFREELDRLAAADPALEVVYALTRKQPPGWTGYRQRVDAALLGEVTWPADQRPLAYVCGPTPFVEVAATGLAGLGYPAERVKTERFGPTGLTGPTGGA